jgi:peptidoglycan/xylan/chitin deacetylase (PgdA/CDA1 family)
VAALPELAGALHALRIPASFACIGAWLERWPEEHRALLDLGFEMLDHTERHPWHDELGEGGRFDALSDEAMTEEIVLCARRISDLGGTAVGFRVPHFGRQWTKRIYPLLRDEGFRYSSSTIAGAVASGGAPFEHNGILEIPLLNCPAHPSALLDSWHCTTAPDAAHRDADSLLAVHREALALLEHHGAFGAVYWDPRVALTAPYRAVLDEIAGFARRGRVVALRDLV